MLARSSLAQLTMKARAIWLISGAGAIATTLLLWPARHTIHPLDASPLAAADGGPAPAVQVQHEFITLDATPVRIERPAPGGTKSAAAEPAEPAAAPDVKTPARPAAHQAPHDAGVIERARRALVGDGKYRPQPFPTVPGNN